MTAGEEPRTDSIGSLEWGGPCWFESRQGLWIPALLLTSSSCTWEALLYNLLKACFFFFFCHPGLCSDVISWVLHWTPFVMEFLTLLPAAIALHVRCCRCLVLSSVAPSSSRVYLSEMWFRREESSCSSQGFSYGYPSIQPPSLPVAGLGKGMWLSPLQWGLGIMGASGKDCFFSPKRGSFRRCLSSFWYWCYVNMWNNCSHFANLKGFSLDKTITWKPRVEPENLTTAGARGMMSFSSDSSLTVCMCVGGWVYICYVSVLFKPEIGDLLWVAGLWLVTSIWYCSCTMRQPWGYANKRVWLCSSKTLMKRDTRTALWANVGLIIESGLSVSFRWSHATDAFSLPLPWLISIDASITANGLLTCLVIPSLSLEISSVVTGMCILLFNTRHRRGVPWVCEGACTQAHTLGSAYSSLWVSVCFPPFWKVNDNSSWRWIYTWRFI